MPHTLTQKIILAGIGVLLGVAILATLIVANVLRIRTAADHLTHVVDQAALNGEFNLHIFRAITEVEAYERLRNSVDRADALQEVREAHALLDQLGSATTVMDVYDQDLYSAQKDLQQQRTEALTTVETGVQHVLRALKDNDTAAIEQALAGMELIQDSVEKIERRSSDLSDQSVEAATATISTVIQQAIGMAVGLFGVFTLVVMGLMGFVRRTIVRPITQLSAVARDVAAGNLDRTIVVTNHDEIGSLQAAFNHMTGNLRAGAETVAEQQRALEARVAERTQAEATLRQREAYFRALIERSPDAIALFAGDGTILYGSPATTRVLGYTMQEFVGRNSFELIHPDDWPQIAQQLNRIIKQPHATLVLQARVRHVDGSWRDMEGMLTNLLDDPAVGAIVNNYRDITERKQAEATLEEERASLAQRVMERTADLSAANRELAHAARLKDEFLASMSHELRTPLNTILGMTETVQEGIFGSINPEQIDALHHVEESGRHLLALINDILDLSKVEAGKLVLDVEDVMIEQVCQASIRLVKQTANQKRLNISLYIDSTVTVLRADTRRIKQMLVNLLSNAVKFTPDGGTIGLDVAGEADARLVHLSVWDTGIGIAADDLPRLFQPFVQLDSRLARQYTGTGLGLALVSQLAEAHGGSVAVESTSGQGSRFTITLPWTPMAALSGPLETLEPVQPAVARRTNMQRALVIEDSPTAAAQLARYLRELGLETSVHPCGEGALEVVLDVRPDVIILDIQLPDRSGWEVLTQFKADPRVCSIPVVVVSVVDDRSHGMALGAAEYLVKPISRQQLQRTLIASCGTCQSAHTAPMVARDQPQPTTSPIILLAEDDENNINTLSTYIAAKGYQVVVARNGVEVLERAHAATPDLILMDIQMPGMDGLEAIRRIRADSGLATIPIIALTALAMSGDRERCLAAGADDYLSKPVNLKGLVSSIEARVHRPAVDAGLVGEAN